MPKKGETISDDHKRRISESNRGKVISYVTRLKISIGNKGKKVPLESRIKMSEAHQRRVDYKGINPSTCFILRKHAEEMKTDPERLSTVFMQELIGMTDPVIPHQKQRRAKRQAQ